MAPRFMLESLFEIKITPHSSQRFSDKTLISSSVNAVTRCLSTAYGYFIAHPNEAPLHYLHKLRSVDNDEAFF